MYNNVKQVALLVPAERLVDILDRKWCDDQVSSQNIITFACEIYQNHKQIKALETVALSLMRRATQNQTRTVNQIPEDPWGPKKSVGPLHATVIEWTITLHKSDMFRETLQSCAQWDGGVTDEVVDVLAKLACNGQPQEPSHWDQWYGSKFLLCQPAVFFTRGSLLPRDYPNSQQD
jgi:hypothetical protein